MEEMKIEPLRNVKINITVPTVEDDSISLYEAVCLLQTAVNKLKEDIKNIQVTSGAYTPDNPPPYPVLEVNEQTGSVYINQLANESLDDILEPLYDENSTELTHTVHESAEENIKFYRDGRLSVSGKKIFGEVDPPPYPVTSVNGQTGNVIVEAGAGDAYTPTNPPPYPVTSVNSETGDIIVRQLFPNEEQYADQPFEVSYTSNATTLEHRIGESARETFSFRTNGKGYINGMALYGEASPPPYPVTSVNGKTGAVTIETSVSDADKQEIANIVIGLIPDATGVSF